MTVLGSGTSVPARGRGAPGYLVRVSGSALAFDLGPGTVHRWVEAGATLIEVEDVYISHLHPDHVTDLVTLLFALRNPYLGRARPLRITGPEGLKDHYRGLMGLYGCWVEEEGYVLELIESAGGETRRGGYTVSSRKVGHTQSSLAFRLDAPDGRSLVYSGDTGHCEGIIELGRGSRTMLLECSLPEEQQVEGHLTPTLAGEIASECGTKKLVLTHFYPMFQGVDIVDRVKKVFGGEVVLAKDMMNIEIL